MHPFEYHPFSCLRNIFLLITLGKIQLGHFSFTSVPGLQMYTENVLLTSTSILS